MGKRIATIIGGLCLVSGCATTAPQSSRPWAMGPWMPADIRLNEVAVRFEDDRRLGGTKAIIRDVEGCYVHAANQPIVQVYELRDCLILDYTAYNTDQVEGRQVNGALSPFFNDEVAITRWTNYGVLARFKDGASEIAYLKDAHQVVQRDLLKHIEQLERRPQDYGKPSKY